MLPMHEMWVPSVVGELRPYMLCGLAKNRKKDWKKYLEQFKAKAFKRDADVISIEETNH